MLRRIAVIYFGSTQHGAPTTTRHQLATVRLALARRTFVADDLVRRTPTGRDLARRDLARRDLARRDPARRDLARRDLA